VSEPSTLARVRRGASVAKGILHIPGSITRCGPFATSSRCGSSLSGPRYWLLVDSLGLSLLTWAIALLTVATGAALLIGYLTPFAGALAALFSLGSVFSWLPLPHSAILRNGSDAVN